MLSDGKSFEGRSVCAKNAESTKKEWKFFYFRAFRETLTSFAAGSLHSSDLIRGEFHEVSLTRFSRAVEKELWSATGQCFDWLLLRAVNLLDKVGRGFDFDELRRHVCDSVYRIR